MTTDPTSSNVPLKGPARIQAYLKTLPDAPGVYRMLDAKGDVLYVGKAKSLKKRVSSYAKSGGHNDRITRMIAETAEMLFVTTASESEALLLELNLIKRLKPRFNVSFRDDKSFPISCCGRIIPIRRSSNIAAPRRPRASISGPSRAPAPSTARSTRCSAPSCCAPVRIRCSNRAPVPACCSRSSAAAARASGASTRPAIANWCTKPKAS